MAEPDPTTRPPIAEPPPGTEHVSLVRRLWGHHRENAVAVAVIVGTLIAIAGVVIAYLAFRDQATTQSKAQVAQHSAEVRAQAEQVSATTLAGNGGFPITMQPSGRAVTRIGLYNRSQTPVYNAVVTLVLVQGAGAKRGIEETRPELKYLFQRDLSAIPPGESEVQVSSSWAGMMARPGIEIAFTDQHGRNWLRYANGELISIPVPAASYYQLAQPVNWIAPSSLQGK